MADAGKDKDNKDFIVVSSQQKSARNSKKKIRFYFIDERHNQFSADPVRAKVAKWRMKDRV